MKCEICGNQVEELFLGKLKGTYIRDGKNKKKAVCSSCQREHDVKEKIS